MKQNEMWCYRKTLKPEEMDFDQNFLKTQTCWQAERLHFAMLLHELNSVGSAVKSLIRISGMRSRVEY